MWTINIVPYYNIYADGVVYMESEKVHNDQRWLIGAAQCILQGGRAAGQSFVETIVFSWNSYILEHYENFLVLLSLYPVPETYFPFSFVNVRRDLSPRTLRASPILQKYF